MTGVKQVVLDFSCGKYDDQLAVVAALAAGKLCSHCGTEAVAWHRGWGVGLCAECCLMPIYSEAPQVT